MISNIIIQICFQAYLQSFPCAEALAIAEIESSLNPQAVGKLGEIGLWQQRPEFWGKIPKKDLTAQIAKGIMDLKLVRNTCIPIIGAGWVACWNIGVTKVKGKVKSIRVIEGPYRINYRRALVKWNRFLDKTKNKGLVEFNYGKNGLRWEYNEI